MTAYRIGSRRGAWSSSRSTASPCKVPEGPTILDGLQNGRASRRRRSATARRSRRRTSAASAWSRSRARACSRRPARARPSRAWRCSTDTERVRHSRKLVLEFLASSVDLSTAPDAGVLRGVRRAARAVRAAGAARPLRDRKRTGHHVEPDGLTAATVHAPVKIDNELYVRDYAKCILCYKCVDACGDQQQNTFAIAVAGRGFDARISTEYAVAAARLGVRLLRQLHRGVPDGRADVQVGVRPARGGHVGRGRRRPRRHDLPVLRRRLQPHAARAGQRDRQGHAPRRPRRHARQPLHQGPVRLPARAEPRTRQRQAMNPRPSTATRAALLAVEGDAGARRPTRLAVEEPLEIRAAGRARSPSARGHDAHAGRRLRARRGLPAQRGPDRATGDVARRSRTGDRRRAPEQQYNVVTVDLRRPFDAGGAASATSTRPSSCGVCGKASIDADRDPCAPIAEGLRSSRAAARHAARPRCARPRRVFERTGGLHAAGLFDADGELLDLREDVGRHNAVDKLVGNRLLRRALPLSDVDRARLGPGQLRARAEGRGRRRARAVRGLGAVQPRGRGRPRLGVTLVGFLRDDRLNVYAHPGRVLVGAPACSEADAPAPGRGARSLARCRWPRPGFEAPLEAEEVRVDEALGRVLQFNLQSLHDVPNTRCAAMDGFAVRAAEVGDAPLPAGRVRAHRHRRAGARRRSTRSCRSRSPSWSASGSRSPAASPPATTCGPPRRTSRAAPWCCAPARCSTRTRSASRPAPAMPALPSAAAPASPCWPRATRSARRREPRTGRDGRRERRRCWRRWPPSPAPTSTRHPPCTDDPELLTTRAAALRGGGRPGAGHRRLVPRPARPDAGHHLAARRRLRAGRPRAAGAPDAPRPHRRGARWSWCPAIPCRLRSPTRCSPSRCWRCWPAAPPAAAVLPARPRPRHRLAPRRRHRRAGLARRRGRRAGRDTARPPRQRAVQPGRGARLRPRAQRRRPGDGRHGRDGDAAPAAGADAATGRPASRRPWPESHAVRKRPRTCVFRARFGRSRHGCVRLVARSAPGRPRREDLQRPHSPRCLAASAAGSAWPESHAVRFRPSPSLRTGFGSLRHDSRADAPRGSLPAWRCSAARRAVALDGAAPRLGARRRGSGRLAGAGRLRLLRGARGDRADRPAGAVRTRPRRRGSTTRSTATWSAAACRSRSCGRSVWHEPLLRRPPRALRHHGRAAGRRHARSRSATRATRSPCTSPSTGRW